LLSAGAGLRMRPLTQHTPKPLLKVADRSLIEYQLDRLKTAGVENVVINTTYQAHRFIEALGDGSVYGVNIRYSHEGNDRLETGGGVLKALPLIRSDPFLIVNSDVWTDFAFESLSVPHDAIGNLLLSDKP